MPKKQPSGFSIDDLEVLRIDIENAIDRINGDTRLDIPATAPFKEDDWNALHTLNWRLDTIVDVLNTDYKNPKLQEAKSRVHTAYLGLVDASKKHKPYLTERYECVIKPKLYDVNHLKKLRTYLIQARRKIEGNNSLDSPNSHYLKDDALDPIDTLNVFLDSIVDVLHTNYNSLNQKKAQSKIYEDYMTLIAVSKLYSSAKLLTEKLENGLKSKENSVYSNKNTIDILV